MLVFDTVHATRMDAYRYSTVYTITDPQKAEDTMTTVIDPASLHSLHLATGGWDIESFLTNAKQKIVDWGSLLIGLLGAAGLVWAAVLLFKKLTGNPQQQQGHGWAMIIILIIVSGAMMAGGFGLFKKISGGGEKTITDLGGGTVIIRTIPNTPVNPIAPHLTLPAGS